MLIDIVNQYDDEKKQYLKELWTQVVLHISAEIDHRKIVSFLPNAWIISIQNDEKLVYIWFPNDFILVSAKKVFNKYLKEAIQTVYNPQFDVKCVVYPPFANGSDLLINVSTLLNIKPAKNTKSELEKSKEWEKINSWLKEVFWILFDPWFRFDNFVAWSNNQFAFSAAKAVAENPGNAYNPLFFYGNVWLWKTHLMQAIWNEIISNNPKKVVIYLPSSKLVDEIVNATMHQKLADLMKKFDNIDALLIDDIQFLAWKEKTQEIFHNIFNDFQAKKKQIIISWDRPPKELTNIEPRLKSRFWLWLVADIQPPDYETRIAILQMKLNQKQEHIESDLLQILAKYITSNVRELEWALNTLISMKSLMGKELTQDDVIKCLISLWYSPSGYIQPSEQNQRSQKNFDTIVEMVANYYSVTVADLKSNSRKHEISTARQMLMLIAKKHFKRTLQKIWMYFWGKNHAWVIYAIDKTTELLKTDKVLQNDYNVFVERVEE